MRTLRPGFALLLLFFPLTTLRAQMVGHATVLRMGPSLPPACTPRSGLFFQTTNPGLYYCQATNVWAQISGGGGGASIPSTDKILKGDSSGNATATGITEPTPGNLSALSYSTNGTGAGFHSWKDSGDSNYVATQGYTGARAASLTLAQPGTDPTALRGVPLWNAPSSGLSTFNSWINPTRLEGQSTTTTSPSPAASVCLMSIPFSTSTPLGTAGAIYQYLGTGNYTAGGSALATFKLQLSTAANCGGVTADLASNTYGTALAATGGWRVTGHLAVLTTGTSGTVTSFIEPAILLTGAAYQVHPTTLASTTVDTTQATYFLNLVISTTVVNPQWNQYLAIVQEAN